MPVSSGDTIQAAEYNNLQSRINTILGNGSGSDGYGQSLSSSQITALSNVTAANMDNLLTDLNKANAHQTGTNTSISNIAVGDIIGANASAESATVDGSGNVTLDPATTDTSKGFNDFETAMTTIENNRFSVAVSQASVEGAITSQRTTAWNGTITHSFTVTFNDADHRRHFFNTGGEIRFTANISGGSGAKTNDWRTMLSNMGTIKFNYTSTTSTGTGTGTAIGNYDLTGSYQQVFQKGGSGVYAENDYIVRAKANSTSQIEFEVRFQDDDAGDQQGGVEPGPAVDENVDGTITSTIQQFRATGSNVSVATPSYSNTSTL